MPCSQSELEAGKNLVTLDTHAQLTGLKWEHSCTRQGRAESEHTSPLPMAFAFSATSGPMESSALDTCMKLAQLRSGANQLVTTRAHARRSAYLGHSTYQ